MTRAVPRVAFALALTLAAACGSSAKKKSSLPTGGDVTSQRDPDRGRPQNPDGTSDGGGSVTVKDDELAWLTPVHFEFDDATLDASARTELSRLGEWLLGHPKAAITVEGHCDERGTTEYNIALGQRRAEAIAGYLQHLGVPRARLQTISYGAEHPIAAGSDETAWAQNRRGEFDVKR